MRRTRRQGACAAAAAAAGGLGGLGLGLVACAAILGRREGLAQSLLVPVPPSARSSCGGCVNVLHHGGVIIRGRGMGARRYAESAADVSSSSSAVAGGGGALLGSNRRRKREWAKLSSLHDEDIFRLAGPALLSLLVDPVLSLMDTAYIGRLGPVPLAALGPCTAIFHASFNTFRSLTASTTSLVSRNLARGRVREAGQVIQNTLALATVLGILVMSILLKLRAPLLTMMGAGPGSLLFPDAKAYLTVRALGAPAVISITTMEGVMRGHSDTRGPAISATLAALINFVLDPYLILWRGWGVAGAAVATVVAQYTSLAWYWAQLVKRCRAGTMYVPFLSKQSKLFKEQGGGHLSQQFIPLLKTILGANTAMLLRTLSLMICWGSATAVATRMGTVQVAAHQVGLSLWLLLALVAESPAIAAQVLGARYLGVNRREEARAMAARAFSFTIAISTTLGGALIALRHVIPPLFTSDALVIAQLERLIPILGLMQPLVSGVLLLEGLLVGAAAFWWLAITNGVTTAIITTYMLWMGSHAASRGLLGAWAALVALLSCRFATAALRILDRKRGPYWGAGESDFSSSRDSGTSEAAAGDK